MNHHYRDILDRIPEIPSWWDENAVPRYGEFTPSSNANIYADEIVLMHIKCQGCGHDFEVCLSSSQLGRLDLARSEEGAVVFHPTLAEGVRSRMIHYGDPPNFCCGAGATMNSVPVKVLEFWTRDDDREWKRNPELEVEVEPDWAKDPL